MKFIDKLAFACALACVVTSAIDSDFSEMMAWIIVVLWNIEKYWLRDKDKN